MNLLDLVEEWAKNKGWWTFKMDGSYEGHPDGYLYIARRHDPYKTAGLGKTAISDVFTLWADAHWSIGYGEYPDDDSQKLEPADPDFFINLKYLIMTKTK